MKQSLQPTTANTTKTKNSGYIINMDNAKRYKKQGTFKRGASDATRVLSAEEALNQYYEKMVALDHKLNK